jgi:hypothetical protein
MDKNVVYALTDPQGLVRYVGKSTSGLNRPREHARLAQVSRDGRFFDQTHKARWIRSLQRRGLSYGIVVLFASPVSIGLEDAERFWIAESRRRGFSLTNLTLGGDGKQGFVTPDCVRKKISSSHIGKALSPEHRAKIADAGRGRIKSAETRAKLSLALKGHVVSSDTRAKISASQRRPPASETEQWVRDYLSGMSAAKIADRYGRGPTSIYRELRRRGLPSHPLGHRSPDESNLSAISPPQMDPLCP